MSSRLVQASGSSFERGNIIGAAVRDRLIRTLGTQEYADQKRGEKSLHDWLPAAKSFMPYIEDHAPETLLEMYGMAEGAGVSFDDILLLACAYEKLMGGGAEHCTGFAAMGAATATGDLVCGQNNDEAIDAWSSGQADIVVHHIAPTGLETLIYTHPGIPAYMGMNSDGLCVLWMYIDNGERGPGVPTCIILRELLRRPSLDAAVSYLRDIPRAVPNNFILAHAADGICNVEYSTDQFHPVRSSDSLCHANHIMDSEMAAADVTAGLNGGTTRTRHACLAEQMSDNLGDIDVETARRMLSDHHQAPQLVCVHPTRDRPQSKTLASMVFHPAEGTRHIAFGNGCETPYEQYIFSKTV